MDAKKPLLSKSVMDVMLVLFSTKNVLVAFLNANATTGLPLAKDARWSVKCPSALDATQDMISAMMALDVKRNAMGALPIVPVIPVKPQKDVSGLRPTRVQRHFKFAAAPTVLPIPLDAQSRPFPWMRTNVAPAKTGMCFSAEEDA